MNTFDSAGSSLAPDPSPRRILVAMSGGVDSSVAAALLVEAGHDVVGVTMKTFCYDATPGPSKTCCGLDGIMDARSVADELGIPHYVFDVEEEFRRDVIDDFVQEYGRGRTPNPCVRCNSNTKFRDLLRRGRALGCDGIATGHYVRISREAPGHPERPALFRGADRNKDQAYFLWALPPELLSWLHFPLGDLSKPEVRALAEERGFVTAQKPESQEICFVPSGDYREFLAQEMSGVSPALEPGRIVDLEGRTVGTHDGFAGFTVGQRKGLGGGFDTPHFVVEIRPDSREVVVGPRSALHAGGLVLEDPNWLVEEPEVTEEGLPVRVQIRHRAPDVPARLLRKDTGAVGGWEVRFDDPQKAVTPGQSAVIFQGQQVLGGGRIGRSDQYRSPADSASVAIASR